MYNAGKALDLGIQPDELTKLIYISTYLNYDNKLILKKEKPMTKNDVQVILRISESTFKRFWKTMTETNLIIQKGEELFLNTDVFCRGRIHRKEDINRIRLYRTSIKYLYLDAKIHEHKLLSYLFQLIPFVNIDYNVICHNAQEKDFKKIIPMTMGEVCKVIGYDVNNYRRLKTKLKKLYLKSRTVFSFVDNANGLFCYINPQVYYAGKQWDKVEILGKFCDKEVL